MMLRQLDILIGFVVVMSLASMVIMVINQMIMSGLQMRGKQLMDALEAMFKTLDPTLEHKAKGLAEAVLRHPVISDSAKSGEKRGLASAIRPEELLGILVKLRDSKDNIVQCAGFEALKHADKSITIGDIAAAAGDVLTKLEQPDQAIAKANEELSTLLGQMPNKDVLMQHVLALEEKAKVNIQSTLQRVEGWFGAVEDRAREWFATKAQQWNSFLAILLVLTLQLDAIKLYRQLESDDAYRNALVGSAVAVQKQAQDLTEHAAKAAAAASAAASSAAAAPANSEAAKVEFDFWKKTAEEIRSQAAELDKNAPTGFQLLPTNYPHNIWQWLGVARTAPAGPEPVNFYSFANLHFSLNHLLGMLFFAALLSLGAPYWFNLLKTLTSFRPLLAQQVDKDEKKNK